MLSEEIKATNLSSNVLFHFTNKMDNIISILEKGFVPHFCPEHLSPNEPKLFPEIVMPMVCFCDIPLALIREHLNHYGSFGIGLKKEWTSQLII